MRPNPRMRVTPGTGIMLIDELIALDASGFLAGPGETEEAYLERICRIRAAHDGFPSRLAAERKTEALEGITVSLDDVIPAEFYDAPAAETVKLYGFAVRHVPGFFLSHQVGWLWGGCLIGDPELDFSIFLLRDTFRHREKWLFYRRDELLAHELCHSVRQILNETTLEEYFAYQTSPSRLRRNFGNCFIRDLDAVLFVLPSLLLLLAEIVRGFLHPAFPAWPFWIAAAAYPAYLLLRNHLSVRLVRHAEKALSGCGVSNPSAVLFRCTRSELEELARIGSAEVLRSYADGKAAQEVRWLVIRERFIK